MKRDQKFFDTYFIVIGVLAAIAIAILVLALKMSDKTQGANNRDSSEYQAAVAERIRPVGTVNLPGEEQDATAPIVAETTPVVVEADPIAAETSQIVAEIGAIVAETDPIVVAADPIVAEAETPTPVATGRPGKQVYNEACLMCHGSGLAGAPISGDAAAWAPRIAQGIDVLNDHAINGYAGSLGFMPAKGGRADLSDDDVRNAVDYMASEAR